MKRSFLTLLLLCSMTTFAQDGINYKALIQDNLGAAVASQSIDVRFAIISDTGATTVYSENHTSVSTDAKGIVILAIGEGNVLTGVFGDIVWGSDSHSLNVKIDIERDGSFVDMGTTQFMMVPYALSAKSAENIIETDPKVTSVTINTVPLWDGAKLVDGSITDVDGDVIIGIQDPSSSFEVTGGRVEFKNTNDANGSPDSGVLEIGNTLRIDGDEIVTNTGTTLRLNDDNNGNVRFDNGTLFVDAANDRVGIGTASPLSKFHIEVGGIGLRQQSTPTSASIGFWTNSTSAYLQTNNTFPLLFATGNGATQMALNTNGNLGIGAEIATAKLDVRGAIKVVDGSQGAGKILTSDADGLASWEVASLTETDPSVPDGATEGDMQYWTGSSWEVVVATPNEGAALQMIGGIPTWVGGTPPPTVPDAPTIGTATSGDALALISFTAPSNDGGSSITVYTATSSPGSFTGTGTSPITLTGLTNGIAYTFSVTATNAIGTSNPSAASNSVTPSEPTVPDAPTTVNATAGDAQASVLFTAPVSDGGSAITLYTATSLPGGFTGTLPQAGNGPITVSGLTNGTAYTFSVTATNAIGTSTSSVASNSVTPDSSIVTIGDLREGGIVFWVDPADNTKGLVCALADETSRINWYDAILYANDYTNPDTGTGVYSNWYLPSVDELQLMYANLHRFGCSTNTPGGYDSGLCATRKGSFTPDFYWSSTESNGDNSRVYYFSSGGYYTEWKVDEFLARAIRAF